MVAALVERKLLLLLLLAAGLAVKADSTPEDCWAGCPHTVKLVCGDDHLTYQSQCLATCAGTRVVHLGPCEELEGSPSSEYTVPLHHHLKAPPPVASSRRSLKEQGAGRGEPVSPPHHDPSEIHRFRQEGFKLVGVVKLHNTAQATQPQQAGRRRLLKPERDDSASGRSGQAGAQGSSQGDPSMVRALRITPAGRLYAAVLDVQQLKADVKAATASYRGASSGGAYPVGYASELGVPTTPGGPDDLVVEVGEDLPGLPYYNPAEHRQGGRRKLQQEPSLSVAPSASVTPTAVTPSVQVVNSAADLADCNSTFPFTAIGQLQLKDDKGGHVCSGVMGHRSAVITAGHCIYRRGEDGAPGVFYSELAFAPGRRRDGNKVVNPFGVAAWAFATIWDFFRNAPDNYEFDGDVGVVRLATNIGDDSGWLGLAPGCAVKASTGEPVTSYDVSMGGYAADQPFGTCGADTCMLYRDTCGSRIAYHTCVSVPGISGAPLYISKDNRVRAIAVGTVTTGKGMQLNVAHMVGTFSYAAVVRWATETKANAIKNDGGNDTTVVKGGAGTTSVGAAAPQTLSDTSSPGISPDISPGITTTDVPLDEANVWDVTDTLVGDVAKPPPPPPPRRKSKAHKRVAKLRPPPPSPPPSGSESDPGQDK